MIAAEVDRIHVQLTGKVLGISAPTVVSGPTCRPAAVVIWSASGRPFTIEDVRAEPVWTGKAAVVAPHFVRCLRADDSDIISINFEPNNPWMAPLSRMVGAKGIYPLEHRRVSGFSQDLHAVISGQSTESLDELANCLATWLLPSSVAVRETDRRVAEILARLETERSEPPSVAGLARDACVSTDRLSHLLAEELGIPYRSYVLWRKYRRALALLREEESLSWVAHAAGFYDQAHMARTFLSYFGYAPSAIREQGLVLSNT